MPITDIKQRVEKIFEECFGTASLEKFRDHPKPFTTHVESAGNPGASELLDSLDHVEFTMALEEAFGVTIPDDQADKLMSLSDVVTYLEASIPL